MSIIANSFNCDSHGTAGLGWGDLNAQPIIPLSHYSIIPLFHHPIPPCQGQGQAQGTVTGQGQGQAQDSTRCPQVKGQKGQSCSHCSTALIHAHIKASRHQTSLAQGSPEHFHFKLSKLNLSQGNSVSSRYTQVQKEKREEGLEMEMCHFLFVEQEGSCCSSLVSVTPNSVGTSPASPQLLLSPLNSPELCINAVWEHHGFYLLCTQEGLKHSVPSFQL